MKKNIIWVLVATAAIGTFVAANVRQVNREVAVHTIKVAKGSMEETLYANGRLAAFEEAYVYSASSGLVTDLSVKPGDVVKKGDPLFAISVKEIREQIETERLNIRMYEAEKEESRIQTFEAIKKLESSAEREERMNQNELVLNKIDLKSENSRIRIEQLTRKLDDCQAVAGADGVVTAIAVKDGQWVNQGQQAVVIMNMEKLRVKSYLNELDANKVSVGAEVRITGDAFEEAFPGVVEFISPIAAAPDPASKEPMVEMEVVLDSKPGVLRPGYQVSVEITQKSPAQLLVPASALRLEADDSAFAYKIEAGKAARVPVKIGKDNGEQIEIVEGLAEGEEIIDKLPSEQLDGKKVKAL